MENSENRHYAVIDQYARKLRVEYDGKIIAESENALILKEVGRSVYNPVFYFPKADISAELIMNPEMKGTCPIKGQSNHWNLKDNPTPMYFGWSYENPHPRSSARPP